MDYGITVEEARLQRLGDGRNVRTPWEHGWRRRIYEQVVSPFWPYLLNAKRAGNRTDHLDGKALMDRFDQFVEEFTDKRVPTERQELFLDAMGFRFEESPPPIELDCHCPWCVYLRLRAQTEDSIPRARRIREQFLQILVAHLGLVLKAPNAYDGRQGVPRISWRFRRAHDQQEQIA